MVLIDDHEYREGDVVVFDFGTIAELGVIKEIYKDGDNISCTIIQPSGRFRIRTLDYDVHMDKLRPIPKDQARYLNTAEWLKRWERLNQK